MKTLFLIMLIIAHPTSYAAGVDALYQTHVPASSSPANDYQKALQIVLTRLNAGRFDTDNPIFEEANAQQLLRSTRTETIEKHQRRHVDFEPSAVHDLMTQAGHQPWIKSRPKLLTWILQISGRGKIEKTLLTPDTAPEIYRSLEDAAAEKGLELTYPDLNKVDGHYFIGHQHELGMAVNLLTQLSQPLNPEAILYVTINRNTPDDTMVLTWEASYHNHPDGSREFITSHPNALGHPVMDGVSAYLFRQGERKAKTSTGIWVKIDGIRTPDAYDQVKDYLEQIPGVTHMSLNSVTEDAVLYKLDLDVPPSLLARRLSKKYIALPAQPEENIINYRFKT